MDRTVIPDEVIEVMLRLILGCGFAIGIFRVVQAITEAREGPVPMAIIIRRLMR